MTRDITFLNTDPMPAYNPQPIKRPTIQDVINQKIGNGEIEATLIDKNGNENLISCLLGQLEDGSFQALTISTGSELRIHDKKKIPFTI